MTAPDDPQPRRWGRLAVALPVGQFLLAGVVAVVLVGLATSVASRRVGEREAIVDARTTTLVRAQGLVEPVVSDDLVDAAPVAVRRVDDVVESSVLDASLVRVKIWRADGEIVYSDEPRLIGLRYELGDDERAAIETGVIQAEVSDLSKPENRFERQWDKLLEVYLPIATPGGDPLLFEAYYRYDAVHAAGSRLWRSFAPISLGSLVLLEVVQVPLAWSLARRLRQRQREREGLLRRALEASEVERRRIAADLHDGVVQDLAGVAYAVSGAARRREDGDPESDVLEESAETVRASIKALRSLLVEIYPPNLQAEGIESALSDLLARTAGRGVTADLDTSELRTDLPPPVAGLLYRTAQEGLRNVLAHAGATSLRISVAAGNDSASLEITDDGRGFLPEEATASAEQGHVGLRSLAGLVADAGGTLRVRSAPGEGTTIRVEVPLR